jgi:hypothetical protein
VGDRRVVEVVDVVAGAGEQLHRLPAPVDQGLEHVAEEVDAREGEAHGVSCAVWRRIGSIAVRHPLGVWPSFPFVTETGWRGKS